MKQDQDPEQVEPVWERFSGELRRWFAGRVARPEEADDLVQETFLRIQRGLGGLRDGEQLGGWVRRIARNAWTDHARRLHPTEALGEEPAAPQVAADDDRRREIAGWVGAFLDGLPEPERQALRLHEEQGLPVAAIAERTGLSESGVKSRLQRGRAKLRAALLACCRFEFDRRGNVLDASPHPGRGRGDSGCRDDGESCGC